MQKLPPNEFGVPAREWDYWVPQARELFNEVYKQMSSVAYFVNDQAAENKQFVIEWETMRWNCAWTAAATMMEIFREGADVSCLSESSPARS